MNTVYPVTPEIIEWMNHNLVPIEASVFRHYRSIIHLVQKVDRAERGVLPKYAALSAIRDYNERKGTLITYEEIRDRSPNFIFADIAEWAAYVDSPEASNAIVSGSYDDPIEAFENAHPDIKWIVLWLPCDEVVIVFRSPHDDSRDIYADGEQNLADGTEKGPFQVPTLPPEIVASMNCCDPDEILYTPQNWSRADAR